MKGQQPLEIIVQSSKYCNFARAIVIVIGKNFS